MKELLKMNINQINQLSPQEVKKEMDRAASSNRNYFVFPHKLASGEIHTVEVHSCPVLLHGKQLLYSIIHDVQDREQFYDAENEVHLFGHHHVQ